MRFYRSQFWRLQKRCILEGDRVFRFIGHNFGDYKNKKRLRILKPTVLSVTILETTKTVLQEVVCVVLFYRSQFWRLQKLGQRPEKPKSSFIGHNFGDYKNHTSSECDYSLVLSVTILETTKTTSFFKIVRVQFYRSQFWRLQKPLVGKEGSAPRFIGHNFGDYKNLKWYQLMTP